MRRRSELDDKTNPDIGPGSTAGFGPKSFDLNSLDLVEALYETLPDPVVVSDSEGRICFANGSTETAFGYSGAELAGMSVGELIKSIEPGKTLLADTSPHRIQGDRESGEIECRRKDGSRFLGTLTFNRVKNKKRRAGCAGLLDP